MSPTSNKGDVALQVRRYYKKNFPTSQKKSILPVTAQWHPLCLEEQVRAYS